MILDQYLSLMFNISQDQFTTPNRMHKQYTQTTPQSDLRHSRTAISRSLLTSSHHHQQNDKTRQFEEAITSLFERINSSVDKMNSQLLKRFENYEWDVMEIVKEEIKQMANKTRQLVNELQEKIAEKEGIVQLQHLKNELDFFKSQALILFQTNKALRLEIKSLNLIIQQSKNEKQITNLVLRKLKKKQIKGNNDKKREFQARKPTIDFVSVEDRALKFRKINERLKTEPAQNIQSQELLIINEKPTTIDFAPQRKGVNRQLLSESCLNSKSLELSNRYSFFSNKHQSKWRRSKEKAELIVEKYDKGIQSELDSQAFQNNWRRKIDNSHRSYNLTKKFSGDVRMEASLSDTSKWQVNLGKNMIEMNKAFAKNRLESKLKDKNGNESRH